MSIRLAAAVIFAAMSLGCSEDEGDDGSAAAGKGYQPLAPPSEADGLQLSMQVRVPSGVEGTWCKYVVMPEQPLEFRRYESRYTPISHHLIVYVTTLSAADVQNAGEVFDCENLDRFGALAGFHYGTQAAEDFVDYPSGVGKRSEPGEVVLIEYHAVNATGADVDAEARVNFWYAKEPLTNIANVLFFYDPVILIEPISQGEAHMHCEIDSSLLLLNVLSHMHKRGVQFEATLSGGSLAAPKTIVTTDTYEPETTRFEPALAIEAGQSIDFSCRYDNPDDKTILEGSSASHNEMCVFAGVYYTPDASTVDIATRLCRTEGSGPELSGTKTCTETEACVLAAEQAHPELSPSENVARERCFLDACQSAYSALSALRVCRVTECREACAAPGAACEACEAEFCAAEAAACETSICG